MLRKAKETLSVHAALNNSAARRTAVRIALGARLVQRDANPRRSHGITFEHLGKLNPLRRSHLHDLVGCFAEMLPVPTRLSNVTILGLAESGIVPAFAMFQAALAKGYAAKWYFSSRTDRGGAGFEEPHSHAPQHFLPPEISTQPADELWIVEDEVTTGQTLRNLRGILKQTTSCETFRCFSILDARPAPPLGENADLARFTGEPIAVESILQGTPLIRNERSFVPQLEALHLSIGETIADDLPALYEGTLTQLQHVTLSPWAVDQQAVFTRVEYLPGYYLYNWQEVGNG